ARAQQGERMRRIGVLVPAAADDPVFQAWVGAFLQGLALLGWTIGRNVRIDTRWATANAAEAVSELKTAIRWRRRPLPNGYDAVLLREKARAETHSAEPGDLTPIGRIRTLLRWQRAAACSATAVVAGAEPPRRSYVVDTSGAAPIALARRF
ncbi:MAG: hypothetical protein ACJ8FU_20130, partial [Xanthobacteraceae bacterium]